MCKYYAQLNGQQDDMLKFPPTHPNIVCATVDRTFT